MEKIAIEPARVVFALVLGYLTESNFRRAQMGSGGDFSVFVTHPISLVCLVLAVGVLLLPLIRKTR
jgi:putative tricarboxylic transport membrane protein